MRSESSILLLMKLNSNSNSSFLCDGNHTCRPHEEHWWGLWRQHKFQPAVRQVSGLMWATVPVLEPEAWGWVAKDMNSQLKPFLLSPEAFHVENMQRHIIKRQGTKPQPIPEQRKHVSSLAHFLAYSTLLYVLWWTTTMIIIHSGVWPKAFWDYSCMPTFISEHFHWSTFGQKYFV